MQAPRHVPKGYKYKRNSFLVRLGYKLKHNFDNILFALFIIFAVGSLILSEVIKMLELSGK